MFVRLRYKGNYKRKITWNSMGECFSYTLHPGKTIDVPISQVKNAKGTAPLVEEKGIKTHRVKKIKKIYEKDSTEVVTTEDEKVFEKQDKLNPFDKYEVSNQEVEVDLEDDSEIEDPDNEIEIFTNVEIEDVKEDVEEDEDEIEEEEDVKNDDVEEEVQDTDFAAMNKTQLTEWLIAHGNQEKQYKLIKERRDTLISMCVSTEATL